jgi:hypothetical protein
MDDDADTDDDCARTDPSAESASLSSVSMLSPTEKLDGALRLALSESGCVLLPPPPPPPPPDDEPGPEPEAAAAAAEGSLKVISFSEAAGASFDGSGFAALSSCVGG